MQRKVLLTSQVAVPAVALLASKMAAELPAGTIGARGKCTPLHAQRAAKRPKFPLGLPEIVRSTVATASRQREADTRLA